MIDRSKPLPIHEFPNPHNLKIDKIQAKIDNMVTRLDSNFMVARPRLIEELEEIQNLLEEMRQ